MHMNKQKWPWRLVIGGAGLGAVAVLIAVTAVLTWLARNWLGSGITLMALLLIPMAILAVALILNWLERWLDGREHAAPPSPRKRGGKDGPALHARHSLLSRGSANRKGSARRFSRFLRLFSFRRPTP